MTFTIDLDEQGAKELQSRAARRGLSVQEFALSVLRSHLATPPKHDFVDDETFREAAAATFAKNDELLRRLAQ